jgi:hypothetical protein
MVALPERPCQLERDAEKKTIGGGRTSVAAAVAARHRRALAAARRARRPNAPMRRHGLETPPAAAPNPLPPSHDAPCDLLPLLSTLQRAAAPRPGAPARAARVACRAEGGPTGGGSNNSSSGGGARGGTDWDAAWSRWVWSAARTSALSQGARRGRARTRAVRRSAQPASMRIGPAAARRAAEQAGPLPPAVRPPWQVPVRPRLGRARRHDAHGCAKRRPD